MWMIKVSMTRLGKGTMHGFYMNNYPVLVKGALDEGGM